MCLSIYTNRTDEVKELLKKSPNKTLTFYKIYRKGNYNNQFGSGITLKNLFFKNKKMIREPGYVFSNRDNKELNDYEKNNNVVEQGIHVFDTKRGADRYNKTYYSSGSYYEYIVVPVECSLNDLIASGTFGCNRKSSVFMKISISAETWKKLNKD